MGTSSSFCETDRMYGLLPKLNGMLDFFLLDLLAS